VLSLPPGEPLQLAGSLDEIPNVPETGAVESTLAARADIRSLGQQRRRRNGSSRLPMQS
jgi:hypothetical protein